MVFLPTNATAQDEISIKQKQMLNTTVVVSTFRGSGSGIIIDRFDTETEDVSEYYVLTNAHVIREKYLRSVDCFSGKLRIEIVNINCQVGIFDHEKQEWEYYSAETISEDIAYDLVVLSFKSKKELPVVKIADNTMLQQIRIFDEVFSVGCPYGESPTPTIGIISQITKETKGHKNRIIYGSTTQIVPGYSGGGLFKKYGPHYYLVGVPYKVLIAHNGQMISHLASSISIITVNHFFNEAAAVGQ